jgi:hypothetical protein
LLSTATAFAAEPAFERCVIDASFENGYQIGVADIDSDGAPDVLALSTTPSQLAWYRNPDWTRFAISTRTERNIDLAPHDVDGDGDLDIALASAFDLGDSTHGGLLHWLECPDDPAADQEWAVHPIDAIPTSHRVRWADITGNGAKELVNLPNIGVGAHAPDYAVGVQFRAYAIPSHPARDAWQPIPIDDSLHMAHGLAVVQWDDDARDDLLTASFEGVHLFLANDSGFAKHHLGAGHTGLRPQQGSSEVALGALASSRFVATIEPWHGNEVVVYVPGENVAAPWQRAVIDDSLRDGHALVCIDIDGDGNDEIAAGNRGEPFNLYIYRHDDDARTWHRHTVDAGGIAAAGLFVADIDRDGRPDLAAVGAATHNVVWYRNISKD